MTSVASETERLRRVLQLELQRGCDNSAVIGGLDRMLVQLMEPGADRPANALAGRIRALPRDGYRSLGVDQRRSWLEGSLVAIAGGESARPPAPDGQAPPRRAGSTASLRLESPVTALPGVGRGVAGRFARLGVLTAGDAALLFPRRFNDFSDMRRIADLQPSPIPNTVVGKIVSAGETRFGRRMRGTEAVLSDGSGSLKVVWFNMPFVARGLTPGESLVVSGKVRSFRGRLQMDNPEYEPFDEELLHTGRLVPVYPSTSGLAQRTLRRAIHAAVEGLADRIPDPIPAWLQPNGRIMEMAAAVRGYHFPDSFDHAEEARRRLALGEFLAIQAAVLTRRSEWQRSKTAPVLQLGAALPAFLASLPFPLTTAQSRCLEEILDDLARPEPMLRLLQGDVGSGKTVVALAGMLAAVRSGTQAAIMAPTEILADQHYRSLARFLDGHDLSPLEGVFAPPWFGRPLRMLLLTGSVTPQQKAQIRADAAHGGADILVGTHALLEEAVQIPRLGLAVVDEQHRFGVAQREKLRAKGLNPHLLVMTATPIPRTLALTVYGDLEASTIDEMPPGRRPVSTVRVEPHEREDAYQFIRERLDAGEQAFVICPLVDESEALAVRSAEEEFERLRRGPLRDYRLDLLHGRMVGREKDEKMERFASRQSDVLVSTSVVEVGIDIPNATVMVIEGAERFGLSQLHQFRGRVGRSEKQSYCMLFSTDEDPGPDARARLDAMVSTTDGFKLAEVDLEMRGEGEAWGRIQSGANTMLRVARLSDRDLLLQARGMAAEVLERDPHLQLSEHRPLAAAARPFLHRAAEAN